MQLHHMGPHGTARHEIVGRHNMGATATNDGLHGTAWNRTAWNCMDCTALHGMGPHGTALHGASPIALHRLNRIDTRFTNGSKKSERRQQMRRTR